MLMTMINITVMNSLTSLRSPQLRISASSIVGILEQLAEWKKMNLTSASPAARLYSLTIGPSGGFYIYNTGQIAIARVVDALYRSSLPFLQLLGRNELLSQFPPAIKAQLLRNQLIWRRHEQLQSKKVPATSLRLFICGDEFAGKNLSHKHIDPYLHFTYVYYVNVN